MSEEFLIGRPSRRQLFKGGLAVAAGPLLGAADRFRSGRCRGGDAGDPSFR